MANVAEVIFLGTDKTSPVAKRIAQSIKETSSEMKGMGHVFAQTGSIVASFGNTQLAGVITQLDNTVMSMSGLTKEMMKSKLGMVALGAAATAGGFQIGQAIRKYIPFFNEVDKLEKEAMDNRSANMIQLQTLMLSNPIRAQEKMDLQLIEDKINAIEKERVGLLSVLGVKKELSAGQEQELFQLKRLKEATTAKQAKDLFERQQNAVDQADRVLAGNMMRTDPEGSMAGKALLAEIELNKSMRQLDKDKALFEEEDFLGAKEQLNRDYYAKLAIINGEWYDELRNRQNREKAERKATNQTLLAGTSQMFENLAIAAQASGKKGFVAFKVFSTAKAIVDTYTAANGAYSAMASIPYVGPALGAAAAAAAIAAGMANVAAINSQHAGQAHAGMDYVPREGSYILQRGEAVLDPGTSEQMRNGAVGGATQITVHIDGDVLFRAMGRASRDGRLNISAKGVV